MASIDPSLDPIQSAKAANAIRDLSGKFSKTDPPFISFSITNPVTYIRKWWKGVMDGEGVDLKLKIHPFTAVMIILAVGGASFGIGRITIPEPILQYVPILASPAPLASPDPWREAAFVGTVQKQGDYYFLIGSDTQVMKLEAPASVALAKLIGKKILASGKYNPQTMTVLVLAASDLEIISGAVPVPTLMPTAKPSGSATPSADPTNDEKPSTMEWE